MAGANSNVAHLKSSDPALQDERFEVVAPGDGRLAVRDYAEDAANWEAFNEGPILLVIGKEASPADVAHLARRWSLPVVAIIAAQEADND